MLPDVDHYIDFAWRAKCKNIKHIIRRTYAFDMALLEVLPNRKDTLSWFMFHSIEFWLAVGTLGVVIKSEFLSSLLMGFSCGALFHIVLDMIYVRKKKIRYAWFLIEFLAKRHLMRKKGIDPDKVYREILKEMQQPTKKKT